MLLFCPLEFQQYVNLSICFFLLAFIKVMNVFEMYSKTSPSLFALVVWFNLSHFHPLFRDFFCCLISSIESRQNPAGHEPAFMEEIKVFAVGHCFCFAWLFKHNLSFIPKNTLMTYSHWQWKFIFSNLSFFSDVLRTPSANFSTENGRFL